MNVENSSELSRRIGDLKREKNAVILAHYYTTPEVQAVADFLGDSLALSVRAQSVDADIILFAGVHFMAETAKVLCPEKKVLIPCPEAGCSLAESCDAGEFAAFKAKYPGHTVVSYVNTTVGVKALTDICCTSSNALNVSVREAFARSELGLMMKEYNTVREALNQQGVLMYSPWKVEVR